MRPRSHDLPWWVAGGSEICAFCGQLYAYQMERRCTGCDTPMCSMCAMKNNAEEIVCCTCEQSQSGG
jgi:hypothetical protein